MAGFPRPANGLCWQFWHTLTMGPPTVSPGKRSRYLLLDELPSA
jgi:hypothetical protein